MIQMESLVQVADNTGARSAKMIGVIGKRTRQAHIGDIITCHIRESIPTASVKKGTVVKCAPPPRFAVMTVPCSVLTAMPSSSSTRTTTRAAPVFSGRSLVNSVKRSS